MRKSVLGIMLTTLTVFLIGCSGGDSSDICAAATQHVAACTGNADLPAPGGGACVGQAAQLAEQALSTSCADMQGAGGKADALSNSTSMAVCISLGIPLFIVGESAEGDLCCFSYNCKDNLTCRKHACVSQAGSGSTCERNGHCQGGLACVFGECKPPLASGEICGDNGDCESGLVCGDKGRCTDKGKPGDSCTDDHQCAEVCINGSCAERSKKGGTCDSGDDFDCDFGLYCITGTCGDKPGNGGQCDPESSFQCDMGETCWEGKCEQRHEAGGPCNKMFDCEFGLFCQEGICGKL